MTTSRRRWKWRALKQSFGSATAVALLLLCIIFILSTLTPSPRSARPHLRGIHIVQDMAEMKKKKKTDQENLGLFGEHMLSFLPLDLPFTVFIPTPSSFQSLMDAIGDSKPLDKTSQSTVLGNKSYSLQDGNRNHALISRIFGFSSSPVRIESSMIPPDGIILEIETLSGFRLNLVRIPPEGTILVNNLVCTTMDISRGSIVIHLVEGVLMESEFERSVMPFKDDDDDDKGVDDNGI